MAQLIPWAKPHFWGNEHRYLAEALESSWISGGPFLDRFEREFAEYCGSPYALTASNGTTAIHMAYLALSINPGDEIIVPGFAFLAAANIALHMHARPVFCEVDPDTWCLRADDIASAITAKTRAIVAVHTYGNVCDMDAIMRLATSHNIPVIEDVAEAFPSRLKGKFAGTFGAIGTFSFQATKTIATGEGGMVLTEKPELLERMKLYRSHGLLRKRHYWHELPGHNFRLTNLQAALGCAQLEKLDNIIAERRRVNARYRSNLSQTKGITLQTYRGDVDAVVWAVALRLDSAVYSQGRDAVLNELHEAGIEARPGFYTPHEIGFYDAPLLPVCQQIAESVIVPPSYPTLSDNDIDRICEVITNLGKPS
jgi:perosamine synthetase